MMDNHGPCLPSGKVFQMQLCTELAAAGLIPQPEHYTAACTAAVQRGVRERNRLRSTMGLPAWWCVLVASGLFSTAYGAKGILGWGYMLAEFFAAPLPLDPAGREAIASLGTLANFIVTFYDTLLDGGSMGDGDDPLPRPLLESVTREALVEPARWSVLDATPGRVLVGLVKEFFQRVDALPGAHEHPDVQRTIRRAVLRLYDAEHRTLDTKPGRGRLGRRALRVKSSYPFVVMGLSGWLLVPHIDPAHYRWHVRWLCRLGEFYGWIDDAVDLADDLAGARPNQVVNLLAQVGGSPDAAAELAHRIAGQGRSILAEWHDRVQDKEQLSFTVAHSFSACLAAWVGSLPASQPGRT